MYRFIFNDESVGVFDVQSLEAIYGPSPHSDL